jgi:integrase
MAGTLQRGLNTLFELAKTPRVHAHLFRHTFATEMSMAGNSLENRGTIAWTIEHQANGEILLALGQGQAREVGRRG